MIPQVQRQGFGSPLRLRPKWQPRAKMAGSFLEAIPWVDVVLLLLIFFMIQSANVLRPGVAVNLPVAPTLGGARYDASVLTLLTDGTLFFNDERVSRGNLSEVLRRAVENDPLMEVVLEADRSISHQMIMNLYEVAVEAGVRRVVLATRERPLPPMMP